MDEEDRIEQIYTEIDSLLRAGAFVTVNALLGALDAQALTVAEILAYLSITQAAAEHLPGRPGFVLRALDQLERLEPNRYRGLWRE